MTDHPESTTLVAPEAPIVALAPADLAVRRPPAIVLAEARDAARAVAEVIAANPHKVILGGRQYLQFADWQVLARFYGVSARIVRTEYVELADTAGFVAYAVALRVDGLEISAAEASCSTDEPKWANKPLFQLRSMAQTRAAAKCLRNVLSFVPVLAGFADTPAEELIDDRDHAVSSPSKRRRPSRSAAPSPAPTAIPAARWEAFRAHREAAGWSKDDVLAYLHETGGELRALGLAELDALSAHIAAHPRSAPGEEMPF